MGVAALDHLLHRAAVGGAQVGHQAALVLHQLHHALVVVPAAEALLDHVEHGQAAGPLRGEGTLLVVDEVLNLPVVVQVDGDAAAQVGHDDGDVLVVPAVLPGVAQGRGAGVQVVAHALAAHGGQAGELVNGQQLVHRDPIVDIGGDAKLEADGTGDHRAHVGGVLVLGLVLELPHHVVVDLVGPRLDGGQQAAPGDDGGEGVQRDAVPLQAVQHQLAAEFILVGHAVEGGELLGGVGDGLHEQGLLPVKDGQLGGRRAGVENQKSLHWGSSLRISGGGRGWS